MENKLLKISIVITNYNYGRYLSDAIESALNQEYDNTEIIVVDDGSTDNSREIISSFKDKIIPVFQKNKGHIEATNTGFEVSTGDLITFLDADDYLFPNMCNETVQLFNYKVAKVHYKLMEVDEKGNSLGARPSAKYILSSGEQVYENIFKGTYITALGNIYSKKLIRQLFPLPKIKTYTSDNYLTLVTPDSYLNPRVPFCGEVKAIQDCLGAYRKHGKNYGASVSPFKSFYKRRRFLFKAKVDTDFIISKAFDLNAKCDQEILFRRYNLIRLRLISYRIDNDHLWEKDNLIYLIFIAIKNLKYHFMDSNYKQKFHKKIYYIIWMVVVSVLPKKILIKKFSQDDDKI